MSGKLADDLMRLAAGASRILHHAVKHQNASVANRVSQFYANNASSVARLWRQSAASASSGGGLDSDAHSGAGSVAGSGGLSAPETVPGASAQNGHSYGQEVAADIHPELLRSNPYLNQRQFTPGKMPERRQFKPSERAVPSSPLGRLAGFGGLAARMAAGTALEVAKGVAGFGGAVTGAAPSTDATMAAMEGETKRGSRAYEAVVSEANMERLAAGLCRMRGAALKVGQMLSLQDESLVPPQLQAILDRVRDGADVMPQRQLNRVMTAELGADWRDKLKHFEDMPFAAASIGQVHRATLHDGREVAMKIQYPGVARSIRSDVSNLKRLLQVLDFLPRGLFLDESMRAAEEELHRECDYEHEAAAQERFRTLMHDEPGVHIPEVIPELSTRSILTSEFVPGMSVDRVAELRDQPGFDQASRNAISFVLLRTCFRELFEFRFMQTDPNWSNFLYNPETGTMHLIDFGASREYSKAFMDDYLRMVYACAERDRDTVVEKSIKLGFLTGDESKSMLDAHVEAGFIVGEPFATDEPYDFEKARMAERVGKLAAIMVKGRLTPPPRDSYTLHRKLSGAFLSCKKLGAKIECRSTFMEFYRNYEFDDEEGK